MSTICMFICHNLTLNTTMIPHNMHIYMLHITRIHWQHYTYLYVQHIYHTNVSKNKTLLSIFICTTCFLSTQVVMDKVNKGLKFATASGTLRQALSTSQYLLTLHYNCTLLYWQSLGFFSGLPNPRSTSGETIQNSLNYWNRKQVYNFGVLLKGLIFVQMKLKKYAYLYSKLLGNYTLKIMEKYLEIY